MRAVPALPLVMLLAACTNGDPGGMPVLFPGFEIGRAATDPAYAQRRGAVELHVKSHHQALLTEIANGGGPLLTRGFDLAGVPPGDRAARLIQMEGDRGLYEANPGALISALMVYGS